MNIVTTIRSMDKVREVKRQAEKMGEQPYLLVLLGLNTGLRISDLLRVRVGEIRDKGYIIRREQKTGKQTEIRLHPSVVADMRRMLKNRRADELLFPSRHIAHRGEPINRNTACEWIKEACRRAGITEPVGCHTLRKTYGYHFYQQFRDIATLMLHFNHATEAITMRYIGITQEQINDKTQKFKL